MNKIDSSWFITQLMNKIDSSWFITQLMNKIDSSWFITQPLSSSTSSVCLVEWFQLWKCRNVYHPGCPVFAHLLMQALACNAAEVDWCPFGRFTADLSPPAHDQDRKMSRVRQRRAGTAQARRNSQHRTGHSNSSSNKGSSRPQLQSEIKLSGGGTRVPLPADLGGKSAYGNASYFLSHQWSCSFAEMVGTVLQHYLRLPEVQRSGGTKFVPAYYWVREKVDVLNCL
jgi:hypothetical protein